MNAHLSPTDVLALLQQTGSHSLAYSALQPGMRYFGDADTGVIAYRMSLGQAIVLGDPIAPPEKKVALLDAFIEAYPRSLHMQIHRDTADQLTRHGYRITPVGVENEIPLDTFTLRGRRKADLRHYRNRAVAGGIVVREEADTPELRAELEPVSDAWLPLKTGHGEELEFLARPYLLRSEPGVRIFTGRIDGAPVGFVIMDPMYRAGRVIGYTVTILRHLPDSPEGTVDYINLEAMAQFATEGVPMLSLGVSPFHRLPELAAKEGTGALPVYWVYRFLTGWGNWIYHFHGLSFHKSRYRANEIPVYTAVRGPFGLWPLFASARACKML